MKDAKISMRLPSDLLAQAQQAAGSRDQSLAEYIRKSVLIKLRREGIM